MAQAIRIRKFLRNTVGPIIGRLMFASAGSRSEAHIVQGHQMFLAPEGRYPAPDMVADKYERSTTTLFKQLLKPGMVAVDVGANVGYFTLLSAKLVGPSGQVYAIEPEPYNYDILRRNIDKNGYSNIVIKQNAVGNSVGRTSFYLSSLDNGSHSVYESAARGTTQKFDVDTITLDYLLETEGWPTVDLVKIDVEGAEMMVLEGMQLLNKRSQQVILIMEYCPFLLEASGINPIDLLKKIEEMGFQTKFLEDRSDDVRFVEGSQIDITRKLLRQGKYMNLVCCKR